VQRDLGQALEIAQFGLTPAHAKPLKGFGGAGVLELVEDHHGSTYRAVYTVRLARRVYVLHAFQKKSKKGIETPKHVIDLIKARLKEAERVHAYLEAQK
jgi:phage-related protein